MRCVSIYAAEPGMILANEVINSMGKVLICKNTELTRGYIEKLIEIGIPSVYIDDELSKGIEIDVDERDLSNFETISSLICAE